MPRAAPLPPLLLALAAAVACLSSSAPLLASAATTCTAAVLHNVASGRCLYHTGEDSGSPHTWGCWQDPNMLIEQDPVGPYVRLRQKWTGQCYYVYAGDLAVHTWTCWGDDAFRWDKLPAGGSPTQHRYRHVDTGRCLEVDAGGDVLSSPCSEGNPRQVFSWSLYRQTGWSPPHAPMAQHRRPTPANDPCDPFEPNLPGRPYVRPYHLRHACPDDGVTFEDLRPWHDPASWGGAGVPPADGTDVVLPAGVNMLVEQCSLRPSVYGRITIPANTRLIFADTAVFMKTRGISLQGELWIGSETCRSHAPIHIEFHGLRSEHSDYQFWRKGLVGSAGSRLEMHGKHYVQTWSRLARTAEAGDTIIYLQDRVNWDKNQEIVIVTSHFQDEPNRNEVRRIKNVWQRAVELYDPLSYQHYGGESYQVEVGLLSRNVMVRGDMGADTHSNFYGGHVMSSGDMRVEGVQAYLMGQRNKIARYPFHFHMGNQRPENYVRDCSVYKSFYRCVTVHGTWGSTVSRNVCYDAWGHGYYIEDGVEEQNTISYNLAAYIHVIGTPAEGGSQDGEQFHETAGLRQPADSTASGFYISNAHNYVYGNAASGGWSGYAFPQLDAPIGEYRPGGGMNPNTILPQNIRLGALNPGERPVLEFDGNTAHSTAYVWSDSAAIYVGGLLWTGSDDKLHYDSGRSQRDPKECFNVGCTNFARVFNNYTNIKVALCDQGFGHWGERVEVYNYEMYDGRRYGTILSDALVAFGIKGRTSNYHPSGFGPARDDPIQVRGFEAYDQEAKTILHDIDFRDMRSSGYPTNGNRRWWNDACALSGNTQVDRTKPDAIFALNHIRYNNNTYQNHFCLNAFDNSGTRYFNYIDYDGYSTNRPQWGSTFGGASLQNDDPTVVSHWWQAEAACELEPEWHLWVCPRRNNSRVASMMVTVQANSFMRLADFDYIDESGDKHHVSDWTNEAVGIYAGKTYLFGNTVGNKPPGPDWNRWAHMTRNANGVVGPSNMGWLMHFDDGTPDNVQLFPKAMPPGSWVIVALQYPPGTTFNIYSNHSKWSGGMHVWETGCPNTMGTCMTYTEVGTFEELMNSELEWVDLGWLGPGPLGNEDFYYFDGTHLFLKIRSWAKDSDEFERYGSSLWTHTGWRRGTIIEANCPAMEPALEEQNFGNVAYNMCAYSYGSQMWAWTCWGDPAFLFYQDIIELDEFGTEIGVGPISRHEHEDEVVRLRQKATNKCIYAIFVLGYVYQADCAAHPAFYWTRILDKKSNNYDSVYRNHFTNQCLTIEVTSADQGRLKVAPCPNLPEKYDGLDNGDGMPFPEQFLFRCKRDIHLVPRCQKQAVSIPSYDTLWEPYVPRPDYYWANDGPYTGCSSGCEGENCRSVVCRQQGSGNIVADSNCDDSDKLYKDSRTCSPCSGPCDGSPCCNDSECEGICEGCVPGHFSFPSWVPQVDGVCKCVHSGQCWNEPHQICSAGVCIDGPGLGQSCAVGSICGEGLECNTLCNRCVSGTGDLAGYNFCLADSECESNNCQGESGCTAGVCTHTLATIYTSKNPCTKVIELSAFTSKNVQKIAVDLEPLLQDAFERYHNLNQEIPPSGNVLPNEVQTSRLSANEAEENVLRQHFADEFALQQEENITLNDNADPPVYSFECVNRVGQMEEDTLVAGLNTIECTVRKLDGDRLDALLVNTNYHVIDRLKPAISCPLNLYMVGNQEHNYTYVELGAPYVRDLGDATPTVEHDAPEGFLFPSGKRTTVIWTATDSAGNTAKCSHSVTIAECEAERDDSDRTCFLEPDYSDAAIIPSLDPYWDSYDPKGETERYLGQQPHPTNNPTSPPINAPWEIEHTATVPNFNSSNLNGTVTMKFLVGKQRNIKESAFAGECNPAEEEGTVIDPDVMTTSAAVDDSDAPNMDELTIVYGFDMGLVAGSNVYDNETDTIKFCQQVMLVQYLNNSDYYVIAQQLTNVAITFNLTAGFTIDINLDKAEVNKANGTANLDSFISAIHCDGSEEMNELPVGTKIKPNDDLDICVLSSSSDVEIEEIASMTIRGKKPDGSDSSLAVVGDGRPSIPAITYFLHWNATGVAVRTRLPTNAFGFEAENAAIDVIGSVALKLKGGRRRLAGGAGAGNRDLQAAAVDGGVASFDLSVSIEPEESSTGDGFFATASSAKATTGRMSLAVLVALLASALAFVL